MAQSIILLIMSLSLVAAAMSAHTLILEWRKAHRQLYGTMNFDGRVTRATRILVLTHGAICLLSLVLLAFSLIMYQFIHFPVL